jgi:hypothetical protein
VKPKRRSYRETLEQLRQNICRLYHPKSAVEISVVPRREGGQGIIDITCLKNRQIMNMRKYFRKKAENDKIIAAIVKADADLTSIRTGQTTTASSTTTSNVILMGNKKVHRFC